MQQKNSRGRVWLCWKHTRVITIPETNSSHLKIDGWKTTSFLERLVFSFQVRTVSFREDTLCWNQPIVAWHQSWSPRFQPRNPPHPLHLWRMLYHLLRWMGNKHCENVEVGFTCQVHIPYKIIYMCIMIIIDLCITNSCMMIVNFCISADDSANCCGRVCFMNSLKDMDEVDGIAISG